MAAFSRGERSRSPVDRDSEWISRQVASLARYGHKRPQGLKIDTSGGIRLSDLAAGWGQKNGYTKQQILSALQKHMYHENSGTLRFQMRGEPPGDLTIRVHRRRDGVTLKGGEDTAAAAAAGGSAVPWGTKPSLVKPKAAAGSIAADGVVVKPRVAGGGGASSSAAKVATPQQSWRDKADERWDDKKSWDKRKGWSDPWYDDDDDDDEDEGWNKQDSWKKGRSSWLESDWRGGDVWKREHSDGEKVQRWLAYALRSGDKNLGVVVEQGGWASIDDLAEAMSNRRPKLGISDGQQLRELLRDTDALGRFEVDDRGRVRKVHRDYRQPRGSASVVGYGGDAWEEDEASAEEPPKGRQRTVAEPGREEPQDSAPIATANGPDAPDKPPGPGWTKYIDDDVIWYFYEGPKGKWWMQEGEERPQVWTEE